MAQGRPVVIAKNAIAIGKQDKEALHTLYFSKKLNKNCGGLKMKKLTVVLVLLAFTACASPQKKTPPDYEGQRDRARQGFEELDRE